MCEVCAGMGKVLIGMDGFLNQAFLSPCPSCSTEKKPKAPKKRGGFDAEDPAWALWIEQMKKWTVTVEEGKKYKCYVVPTGSKDLVVARPKKEQVVPDRQHHNLFRQGDRVIYRPKTRRKNFVASEVPATVITAYEGSDSDDPLLVNCVVEVGSGKSAERFLVHVSELELA